MCHQGRQLCARQLAAWHSLLATRDAAPVNAKREHKVRDIICVMPHVLGRLQYNMRTKGNMKAAVNRRTTLSVPARDDKAN